MRQRIVIAVSRQRVGVLMLVLLMFWAYRSPEAAGQGSPWFGLETPKPSQTGRQAIGPVIDSVYENPGMPALSLRLPPEQDRYRDISGPAIHRDLTRFCQFSEDSRRAGDPLWGRMCGMPAEHQAAAFVREKFAAFGLADVRVEPVGRGAQWWPTEWELSLIGDPSYGPGTRDYVFASAFPAEPSPATPPTGLEAELVYVGLGRPVDLVGRNLRGKIAVVLTTPAQSTFSHTGRGAAQQLVDAGAIGVITIVNVPGNLLFHIQGTGSDKAPCFTLGGDDAAFLEQVIARAGAGRPLKARMKLRVERKTGLETQNVFGLVRGSTDEYVLITAHLDAYFYGASDNASGLATVLALAEHYAKRSQRPRRSLLFVATGGHHAGSVGVANILSKHADVMKRTVLVLNCEHTAAILARSDDGRGLSIANTESPKSLGVPNGSPLLIKLMAEALDKYGVVVNSRPSRSAPGDAGGFVRAGVTVLQLIESNYWYHTSGDRPETISAQGLERTARAYAQFIDSVDKASRKELERGATPTEGSRSGSAADRN